METIDIKILDSKTFKFINGVTWHNVSVNCELCSKILVIEPHEFPTKYPENRPIVFTCRDCGGHHKWKVRFVREN